MKFAAGFGLGLVVGFTAWPALIALGFLRAVRAERDQTDVF